MTHTEQKILNWWNSDGSEEYKNHLRNCKTTCERVRMCLDPFFPAIDMLEYNKKDNSFTYIYNEASNSSDSIDLISGSTSVVLTDNTIQKRFDLP